jgi:galactose mutarotase-like enzyme
MQWQLIGSESTALNLPDCIPTDNGPFLLEWKTLQTGRSQGVQTLTIDTGRVRAIIVPTRGMGLWRLHAGGWDFGWQSPMPGPVHPQWVPIMDPSGLGWLEGFDELLVRCGLHSNGAPEFQPNGSLLHPLHGRIANLPAHALSVSVDPRAGTLDVLGHVDESRFLIRNLSLQVHYHFKAGHAETSIVDTVTNRTSKPSSMQLLYHINVGQPILEAGSTVHASLRCLAPRNAHAAQSIDTWNQYLPPTDGFAEQVYFAESAHDPNHWSHAVLADSQRTKGLAVHYDGRTLPYLSLWKNTAAVEDGYVTGIEPGTGFPNPRSFEESQARVVPLAPGESRSFRLRLEPVVDADRLEQIIHQIQAIGQSSFELIRQPVPAWSAT